MATDDDDKFFSAEDSASLTADLRTLLDEIRKHRNNSLAAETAGDIKTAASEAAMALGAMEVTLIVYETLDARQTEGNYILGDGRRAECLPCSTAQARAAQLRNLLN